MNLVHEVTGAVLAPGCTLHVASGPALGQAWRFERIMPGEDSRAHMVHVSRSHPRLGRIHRQFPPHFFACKVVEEMTRRAIVALHAHNAWQRLDEWFMAGVIALFPLAFFERFHGAEHITIWLGMGGH